VKLSRQTFARFVEHFRLTQCGGQALLCLPRGSLGRFRIRLSRTGLAFKLCTPRGSCIKGITSRPLTSLGTDYMFLALSDLLLYLLPCLHLSRQLSLKPRSLLQGPVSFAPHLRILCFKAVCTLLCLASPRVQFRVLL